MSLPSTPQVPSLTIGGRVITDVGNPNLKMLSSIVVSNVSGFKYASFSDAFLAADFQIPAGKKLYVRGLRLISRAAATGTNFYLGYGDAAPVANAAPTNLVLLNNNGERFVGFDTSLIEIGYTDVAQMPALKYPCIGIENISGSTITATMLCEVR